MLFEGVENLGNFVGNEMEKEVALDRLLADLTDTYARGKGRELKIPDWITIEEIYDEIENSHFEGFRYELYLWLTGTPDPHWFKTALRLRDKSIIGNHFRGIAKNNYTECLPNLRDLPNPTLTKTRLASLNVDLDYEYKKQVLDLSTQNRWPDGPIASVMYQSDFDILQYVYYDAHILSKEMVAKTSNERDVLLYENVVKCTNEKFGKVAVYEWSPEHVAVVSNPNLSISSSIIRLYSAYVACRNKGIRAVKYFDSGLGPYTSVVVIQLLVAWVAEVELIGFPLLHDTRIVTEYSEARTPREFIQACAFKYMRADSSLVEAVFDHRLAIEIMLGLPEGTEIDAPNMEELRYDTSLLLEDGYRRELETVFTGGTMNENDAIDFFTRAAEFGCRSIMRLLLDSGYIDGTKYVVY